MGIERRQLPQPAIKREADGDTAEKDDKGECDGICDMQSKLGQWVGACREFRERHSHDQEQSRDPGQQRRKPEHRQHDKRQHLGKRVNGWLFIACGIIAPKIRRYALTHRAMQQRPQCRPTARRCVHRRRAPEWQSPR
jgi:hypothetical protein